MIAMPEVGIGLFPDVGGTYFLPRLPGRTGLFLALTGWRLKGADAVYCGLATDYVPGERMADLAAAFAEADWTGAAPETVVDGIIERFKVAPPDSEIAPHQKTIDHCFSHGSVEAILQALEESGDAWAAEMAAVIRKQSPTSLKVTFAQLERGAGLDFDQAMVQEYRMSQAFMAGKDFYEGIRALLVDKDRSPKWSPASLAEVTPQQVESHFAPLGDKDLVFS